MSSIREVARVCGVSPMTVSFVLNNKEGQVSEETRERVLKAIREMGYRPSALRSASTTRDLLTLGMVAGVASDSLMKPGYYNAVSNGVLTSADKMGHNVTFFTTTLMHIDTRHSVRAYCDGRCDGLMVLAPPINSDLVEALKERGFPYIVIGDWTANENTWSIDVDNAAGAKAATEFLLAQGHRRIAFLGGYHEVRSTNQRLESYRATLIQHGIQPDPALEYLNLARDSHTDLAVTEISQMSSDKRPTAIFAWNDGTAEQTVISLRRHKMRIPEDISIIGFDDIVQNPDIDLTTMHQPFTKIGSAAVEMLVEQIRDSDALPQRKAFQAELIIRKTVGPPAH